MCRYFNPVQSATFNAAFHSDVNMVVSAPTGSGKTGEAALLHSVKPCIYSAAATAVCLAADDGRIAGRVKSSVCLSSCDFSAQLSAANAFYAGVLELAMLRMLQR